VVEGLNGSLKRLQLDYVDVVYAHRPDRQTPMEEIVRAFNHVIEAGKAFYWGTSEWNADEIAQAWRYADKLNLIGPIVEQPQYNMLVREKVEKEFAHLYRETGLGLTVFSPLKSGILTGKYKDGIPDDSRYAQEGVDFIAGFWRRTGKDTWKQMIDQVNKLEPIAKKLEIKQSTLALAWVLKNPNVSSAIIGASSPDQIYENMQALAALEKITPEIMDEIDDIFQNKPPAIVPRY
jgi:aryl-alcohol dehydrogenase-like predicted oxidoreductase